VQKKIDAEPPSEAVPELSGIELRPPEHANGTDDERERDIAARHEQGDRDRDEGDDEAEQHLQGDAGTDKCRIA